MATALQSQITRLDPPLLTVGTAYPPEPLQAWPVLLDPPVQLSGERPRGYIHLDRRVDFPAICFGAPLHLVIAEIHT